MKVAVIPARGGSKRIPGKNIQPFAGKPMIAHSIETAIQSGLFEHVLVSTDDPTIGAVAERHGASVPFERPAELADDHATVVDVMAHAAGFVLEQGWDVGAVCCIYATAPFIDPGDLARGADAIDSGRWDYAFAVTDFGAPIFRAFSAHPDGGVEMFFPEHVATRSQDLPVALHDAGQFCYGLPRAWIDKAPVFARRSFPVRIPRWRAQDIDTPEDWARAELIHRILTADTDTARAHVSTRYARMPRPVIARGPFSIEAVQPAHIEGIRRWRNAQLDVLRQPRPIDPEEQRRYYEERIWPTLASPAPANILVSYLRGGTPIGYGGLVHIDWPGKNAEVSFLLDPALTADAAAYREHHVAFLELIQILAFEDLGFQYLTTETFPHRVGHMKNLEAAGFVRTDVIPRSAELAGARTDSIFHRCDRPRAEGAPT